MNLSGKVAVITGGSRGIGFGIALEFAKQGANLLLIARNESRLKQAQDELLSYNINCLTLAGDVSKATTIEDTLKILSLNFKKVDILVNCAGIITREPMQNLDPFDWQRVIDVNLNGTFNFCRAILPKMVENNSGKIINISSQMAFIPHPSASPSYEVSKAGIQALTKHMALHYAKFGININAIAPGSINTDLPKSMSVEARKAIESKIPLARLGEVEEVGKLAAFLASGNSDYITGATFDINGGSLMR